MGKGYIEKNNKTFTPILVRLGRESGDVNGVVSMAEDVRQSFHGDRADNCPSDRQTPANLRLNEIGD